VNGRELEMPRPIHVILRAGRLAGTTLPVYAISGHLFVMNDGTRGIISLFDGAYEATFDGDIFESDYSKVEGIRSGKPVFTVKKGQPIWPEWTGKDTASDIGGKKYVRHDGEWAEQDEEGEENV